MYVQDGFHKHRFRFERGLHRSVFPIYTPMRVSRSKPLLSFIFADSCLVDNGGCTENSKCSHDSTTNACKCTCKTGYTNTGSDSNVVCTGAMNCLNRRDTSCLIVDSCRVNNGGCPENSKCAHDDSTNACTCTCKVGYTDMGSASNVMCVGKIHGR